MRGGVYVCVFVCVCLCVCERGCTNRSMYQDICLLFASLPHCVAQPYLLN